MIYSVHVQFLRYLNPVSLLALTIVTTLDAGVPRAPKRFEWPNGNRHSQRG